MNSELRRCIIVSGKPEFFQMDLPGRKRMLGSQEHRASYREAPGVSLEMLHFQPKNTAARTGKAPGVSLEKLHFQPTNTATPGKLQASAWRYFTFNPKHVVRYVDG